MGLGTVLIIHGSQGRHIGTNMIDWELLFELLEDDGKVTGYLTKLKRRTIK
jgi:hypothetical protein